MGERLIWLRSMHDVRVAIPNPDAEALVADAFANYSSIYFNDRPIEIAVAVLKTGNTNEEKHRRCMVVFPPPGYSPSEFIDTYALMYGTNLSDFEFPDFFT
jgi:hypothetical protein